PGDRHAAPLRDARPALDTVVERNLLALAQGLDLIERELDRVHHRAVDEEAVVAESVGRQSRPLLTRGDLAVGPEIGRDVLSSILVARLQRVEEPPREPLDKHPCRSL